MHASSYRYTTAHLIYAIALAATAAALFGRYGLLVTGFVLLIWWQILWGARRERQLDQAPQIMPRIESEAGGLIDSRGGVAKTELLVILLMIGLLVGLLLPAPRDVDPLRHAEISMKMVARALQEYQADHGDYPPTVLRDAAGEPMHSWRALLLPYLEEEALAAAYDYNEPWNGPHNASLAKYRPWHFRVYYPAHQCDEYATSMQAVRVGDQFLLLEHEDFADNWLKPICLRQSAIEKFATVPEVGRGFWERGFFTSSYRGRLIVSPTASFQVHPSEAATIASTISQPLAQDSPVVIGRPLTHFHFSNAFHLVTFALVALYPIRWLRRIRRGV